MLHNLNMHILTTYKPDSTVECPHLQKVFTAVGVRLPSRRAFAQTIVPREYEKVKTAKRQRLSGQKLVVLTSDGWRNCLCAKGTPLINICVLLPSGVSVFIKAVNVAGISKTGEWVALFHEREIAALQEEYGFIVVGVVMDGPTANQKSWRLLTVGNVAADDDGPLAALFDDDEELESDDNVPYESDDDGEDGASDMIGVLEPDGDAPLPDHEFKGSAMFMLWCTGHVLNLAIGDAAKHAPGIETTLAAGVSVSNTVNKSDKVSSMLSASQAIVKCSAKSIPRHCPTRFGIRLGIMDSVFIANGDSFKHLVNTPEWAAVRPFKWFPIAAAQAHTPPCSCAAWVLSLWVTGGRWLLTLRASMFRLSIHQRARSAQRCPVVNASQPYIVQSWPELWECMPAVSR